MPMNIEILEKSQKRVKLKLIGEDNTFCNLLRETLWSDSETEFAGYTTNPANADEVIFILETKNENALDAVKKAISNIKKSIITIETSFKNLK